MRPAPRLHSTGDGEIRIRKAYEKFDSDARNDWLAQLQQKIRSGINPPPSPGPSRSPSPFETLEERQEREAEEGRASEPEEDELMDDEGDDEGEAEVDLIQEDYFAVEEDHLFSGDEDQGVENGVYQPVVNGVEAASYLPSPPGDDGDLFDPSLLPSQDDLPESSAMAQQTYYSQSEIDVFSAPTNSNPLEFPDQSISNQLLQELIDPNLLTDLAQQLEAGLPQQGEQEQYLPQNNEDVYMGEGADDAVYSNERADQSGQYDQSGYGQDSYHQENYAEAYPQDQGYDQNDDGYQYQNQYPAEGEGQESNSRHLNEEYVGRDEADEIYDQRREEEEVYDDNQVNDQGGDQHVRDDTPDSLDWANQDRAAPVEDERVIKRRPTKPIEEDELFEDEEEGDYSRASKYVDDEAEEGDDEDEDEEEEPFEGDTDDEEEEEEEEEEQSPVKSGKTPQLMKRTSQPEVIEMLDSDTEEEEEEEEGSEVGEQGDSDEEEEEEEEESGDEAVEEMEIRGPRDNRPRKRAKRTPSPDWSESESEREDSGEPAGPEEADAVPSKRSRSPLDDEAGSSTEQSRPQANDRAGSYIEGNTPPPPSRSRDMSGTPQQPIELESGSEGDDDREPVAQDVRGQEVDELDQEEDEADVGENEVEDTGKVIQEDDELDELDSEPEDTGSKAGPMAVQSGPQHLHFVDDEEDQLAETQPPSPSVPVIEDIEMPEVDVPVITEDVAPETTSTDLSEPTNDTSILEPPIPSSSPSIGAVQPQIEHRHSPIQSLTTIPTAEEEEEQLEEMTVDVDESRHQPILVGHEVNQTPVEKSSTISEQNVVPAIQPALLSIPTAEEEEIMLEETVAEKDDIEVSPKWEVEEIVEEVEERPSTVDTTVDNVVHHHENLPDRTSLLSFPSAEEEERELEGLAPRQEEAPHQPIMIDDARDIPMPAAVEGKEDKPEPTNYAVDDSINNQPTPMEITENSEEVPANMGFADYILQPPQHPEPRTQSRSISSSPVPMSLADELPAEMTDARDYRDLTPDPISQPPELPIDSEISIALDNDDTAAPTSRSPSMEVLPPASPPQADMAIDTNLRPESPVDLPDPQAPPPDTHVPAPILPQDLVPSDKTPTASIIAEAPDETPTLPITFSTDTPRPRAETPTEMPDPRLPPVDARLPMPDIPLQVDTDHSVAASLIVNAPPVEEQEMPSTATEVRQRSPPPLVIRDFAISSGPRSFPMGQGSGLGFLSVSGSGDLPLFTPNSEMEVEFAVPAVDTPMVEAADPGEVIEVEVKQEVESVVPDVMEDEMVSEEARPDDVKVRNIKEEENREEIKGEEEDNDHPVSQEEFDMRDDDGLDLLEDDSPSHGVDDEISNIGTKAKAEELDVSQVDEVHNGEDGETEVMEVQSGDVVDVISQQDGTSSPLSEPEVMQDFIDDDEEEADQTDLTEPDPESHQLDGSAESPAREDSVEHEPLRHHHRGSVSPSPVSKSRSNTTPIRRTQQRYPRGSLSVTDPAVTRSHCTYRKLRIVENDLAANVLVPQCVLGDTERMSHEESVDLGEPTATEEKEARKNRITHSDPLLAAALAAKLHRVAGASIFDDGHCFLLSTSPGGRAIDEIREKTPSNTPKRASRGRLSGIATTPSITLQAPEEVDSSSAMKRETSRTSRRSISQISDLTPSSPGPVGSGRGGSVGPRRSVRHARSGSRMSQISSEYEGTPVPEGPSSGMSTRARSVQPLVPSGSLTSVDTERDTTPVPSTSDSKPPRRSLRLSMSVEAEDIPTRGESQTPITSSQTPEIPDAVIMQQTPEVAAESTGSSTRSKGKAKEVDTEKGSEEIDEEEEEVEDEDDEEEDEEEETPSLPSASASKPRTTRTPTTYASRRSIGKGKEGSASYRPTTPEISAEETDETEEEDVEPESSQVVAAPRKRGRPPKKQATTPGIMADEEVEEMESGSQAKKAKTELDESSPVVTGTRKRGRPPKPIANSPVIDKAVEREVEVTPKKRETRSGKRKADDDNNDNEGGGSSSQGQVERSGGVTESVKKKRWGWWKK